MKVVDLENCLFICVQNKVYAQTPRVNPRYQISCDRPPRSIKYCTMFLHVCETAGKSLQAIAGNKHCVFACQVIYLLIYLNSSAFFIVS